MQNIKKKIKGRLVPYRKTDQALVIDQLLKKENEGRQWLSHCAPNAGGMGSIPGGGTISHIPQLRPGIAI